MLRLDRLAQVIGLPTTNLLAPALIAAEGVGEILDPIALLGTFWTYPESDERIWSQSLSSPVLPEASETIPSAPAL